MADLVVVEHPDNRRFDPGQTAGKKSDPLPFGNQNGHSDCLGSFLGRRRPPAR